MEGKGQYYDYNCHALLTKHEAEAHRQKGCDVDNKSQRQYKEEEALQRGDSWDEREAGFAHRFQMGLKP